MSEAATQPLPTIRAQIYALVWACVVPALIGLALLANNFYERERDQIQLESLITARALAQAVDRDLNTGITMAMALSHDPSLDRGDLAAFYQLASKALRPEFPGLNFVLSDRQSVQLLNTVRPYGSKLADPGSYERINQVFQTGRTLISDVFIGGALQRPLVAVHVPVEREGKVLYVLSVAFLPERLGKILSEQHLPEGRVAGIFDRHGVIVARSHQPEKFVGKYGSPSLLAGMADKGEAALRTTTLEGTPVYSMYSHSQMSGWAVVIGVPRSTVMAEMLESIRWISLGVVVLLALGITGAWYFARRIEHSVRDLSVAASALGKGGRLQQLVRKPQFREADEAMQTLQAVEAELQHYRHQLESAIEARTHELQLARRAAVDREARTRTVIDNVGDGIITMTADGRIASFNRAASSIFGYRAEEVMGQQLTMLMPESMRAAHEAGVARYLAGFVPTVVGRNNIELQGLHKNGHTFVLELSIRALFVEGQHLFVGIVRDVTERKRAERELRQAMEQAQIASAAKDVFVANMSHELRTPMNAVLGMAHLLATTGLTPEQGRYLEMIRASGQSLLGILNDILDFSKMSAGKIEVYPAPFDLDEVLHALASIMSINVGERNLELSLGVAPDVPRALIGDALRLQQILVNLTGNAIKFTEQGEVAVLVERAEVPGAAVQLRFTVRDTGIGMTDEQLARLFSPFVQGDLSTTRRFGGTGLGLTISKGLIELLGGGVEVRSKPGLGSTFQFTLPFQLSAQSGPNRSAQPRHLLLVDDNPSSLAALEMTLAAWGWTSVSVGSGSEALAHLCSGVRFDVVLVDWQLPDMAGPQLIGAVRQEFAVPLICMVNAFGRSKLTLEMSDAAAPEFLTKPVTASSLFDAVQTALAPATSEVVSTPAPPQLLAGARLLLAEDNLINQAVAKGILEQAGAQVTVAANGEEALDLLRSGESFDLILMDVQMPKMDGYTATRAIRRELRLHLPVLAMTAGVMASEREQCVAAGMDDFIGKPLDVEQMMSTILRHLPAA
ncbi:response regulator [Pseudoduganella danionis]|uniref:histidine kinase n=1 Tax=Pseudoduganella danionis TaxID=1890295 RepID=A0ABW9SU60_9BURK|nr:response regulator [Pseudoduganella danionis]MTW34693.1 response regulator [Pseudoduganella danionis]